MEKFEGYVFTALCSTNFLVSCLLFSRVTREQREPYMDEIFHVPQAQKYCHGKFNEVKRPCGVRASVFSGLRQASRPSPLLFKVMPADDAITELLISTSDV